MLGSLGAGERYEVLLVWDHARLAVLVARVLRPHLVGDREALRALELEAEALRVLAHPVIVRGFDAVLDGPIPHLLVEHLEDPTLGSHIRDGTPVLLQQLLPLALHVAAAAHYLAANGWVHLNITPDNLVLGIPPRLTDLSLAMRAEATAGLREPRGTDAYMAPEQCGGPEPIGPAADVWGLGASLWHVIAAKPPFPRPDGAGESSDPRTRFPQLVRRPDPLPRRTPPPVAELLHDMLAPAPEDRPMAGEVAARLEPLVGELPRRAPRGRRR